MRKSKTQKLENDVYRGIIYHTFTDAFTVAGIYNDGRAMLFPTLGAALAAKQSYEGHNEQESERS
jgi:hypothetical protein